MHSLLQDVWLLAFEGTSALAEVPAALDNDWLLDEQGQAENMLEAPLHAAAAEEDEHQKARRDSAARECLQHAGGHCLDE